MNHEAQSRSMVRPLGKAIPQRARQKIRRVIEKEISRYEACLRLLDRVDAEVYSAGMEFLESEEDLARSLGMPARSLGGKIPLRTMRSLQGRRKVA